MEKIMVEVLHSSLTGSKHEFKQFAAWLMVDTETVAFFEGRFADGAVSIYDIETREEYRNQGYSKKIIAMVAEYYGVNEIQHSGSYTPEGFDYVRHQFKRTAGCPEETEPTFDSITFVADWDRHWRSSL